MRGRIILLASGIAVIGSNSLSLSPISASVGADLGGVSAADVMLASAAYGAATAVGGLALAPSADRIGAAPLLARAMALLSLALAGAAAAPTLATQIAAQALARLAAGAAIPAIYSLAAQIAPEGRETAVTGYVISGWTISIVLGVSFAALVAEIASWRVAIGALAGGAALASLVVARTPDWGARPTPAQGSVLGVLRVRGLGAGLVAVAGFMTAFYGFYTYVGAHVVERLGLSTGFAGAVGVAYGHGFGAAAFFGGALARRRAPLVYLAVAAVYLGLAAAAAHGPAMVAGGLVWGFAAHLGMNLLVSRLTSLDPGRRGAIMGLYSAATYLSVTVGALAFRPVYDGFGLAGCALLSALCVLPAAALSASAAAGKPA